MRKANTITEHLLPSNPLLDFETAEHRNENVLGEPRLLALDVGNEQTQPSARPHEMRSEFRQRVLGRHACRDVHDERQGDPLGGEVGAAVRQAWAG